MTIGKSITPAMRAMLGDIAEVAKTMRETPALATADPRFWVVQQHVWRDVPRGSGGMPYIWDSDDGCAISPEDFPRIWLERLLDDPDEVAHDGKEPPRRLRLGHGAEARLVDRDNWEYAEAWDVTVTDASRVIEDVEDGLAGDWYGVCWRDWEWQTVEGTLFVSLDACNEHIEANSHHYDHPRAFCMHAWRSPDVAALWKALKGIDWDAVADAVSGGTPAS